MSRSDVIKEFLTIQAKRNPNILDFLARYTAEMQCHVMVAAGEGKRIDKVYTDGCQTWYPFVIYNQEDNNKNINYDFLKHVESIGLTGWDWKDKLTRWVAFDFDSIVGHQKGLTEAELLEIVNAVKQIPWVEVRRSTSGRGIHLYVTFARPIGTENRAEHAAVARAVLHRLSALAGFNFKDKVDICGGNMFIWHRKCVGTNGFEILKSSSFCHEPPDWHNHVDIIKQVKRTPKEHDRIAESQTFTQLDDNHKALLAWLEENECRWWWDGDKHMLITHTKDLEEAHTALAMTGIFNTASSGKDRPDHNCFCFPLTNGGWVVRRFGKGTQESEYWNVDDSGWTKSYLNRDPDFQTIVRHNNGVETESKGFKFPKFEDAMRTLEHLGTPIKVTNPEVKLMPAYLKEKGNKVIMTIEDPECKLKAEDMQGWVFEKKKWVQVKTTPMTSKINDDLYKYDAFVRHVVSNTGENIGWYLQASESWILEPIQHVKLAMVSKGIGFLDVEVILGNNVLRNWQMVSLPFQPEYVGDRKWNRNGTKLKYIPSVSDPDISKCPNWSAILDHIGGTLDYSVSTDKWCQDNDIKTGSQYLLLWIASLFQEPTKPLPYLFLYGPQDCGKSILHEAIATLMIGGYAKVDQALKSSSGFNAELEGTILCVVEETDLSTDQKMVYNRMKDWVTAKEISIHPKGGTPYMVENLGHWIQTANTHTACPIFPGDTRITVINVPSLQKIIPKEELLTRLQDEASEFLNVLLAFKIPDTNSRLNVPTLTTQEKLHIEDSNSDPVEDFLKNECKFIPGHSIALKELFDRYLATNFSGELMTIRKFQRALPPELPRGNSTRHNNQVHVGNITFDKTVKPNGRYVSSEGRLKLIEV